MMQQKAQITEQQLKNSELQVNKLAAELDQSRNLSRIIVHIDMDAFYAAVEMRDNPELRNTPMAVGSMSMLSTSNYLARRFGVRAAMPGFIAKKLCPGLAIVPLNFDKYRDVSKQVREVLAEYDPNFLPMSLDEAYLDLTEHLKERNNCPEDKRTYFLRTDTAESSKVSEDELKVTEVEDTLSTSPVLFEDSPPLSLERDAPTCEPQGETVSMKNAVIFGKSVEDAVKELRFRIEQKTTLTASAGIAPNMMLAKVCSDKNKPNGQYRIPSDRQAVMDFIKDLPIRRVPGIGKVTEKMLKALGITTCTDLYQQRALLALLFSETSWHNFLDISLGLGSTHIERDGERKSMSTERTFNDMWKADEQYSLCQELCSDLAQDMLKEGLKGKTVTLKVKNVKFEVRTRASTVLSSVSTQEEIFSVAKELLRAEIEGASPQPLRLRLMGVRVSGFLNEEEKKHHQISIINFLKVRNAESNFSHSQPDETASRQSTQPPAGKGCGESFFNKKRAVRQQNDSKHFVTGEQKSQCARLPISTGIATNDPLMLSDTIECQSLTCPVCFQKQENSNLEAFNRHIDQCLSWDAYNDDADGKEAVETIREAQAPLNNTVGNKEGTADEVHISSMETNVLTVNQQNDSDKTMVDTQPNSTDNFVVINTQQSNSKKKYVVQEKEVDGNVPTSNTHHPQNHLAIEVPSNENEHLQETEDVTETWQTCSATLSEDMGLVCPVCNLCQKTTDLSELNKHVDICLNKGIIQELKKERMFHNNNGEHLNSTGTSGRGQQDLNTETRAKRSGSSAQQPASKKPKPNNPKHTIDKFFK
ncbi:DNA polymerase kappa isoform X2 [Lissotriton helveticus]